MVKKIKMKTKKQLIILLMIILLVLLVLNPVQGLSSAEKEKIEKYNSVIQEQALEHKIPPALLKTVIFIESGGDPDAVSCTGAVGLTQFTTNTAQGYFPEVFKDTIKPCSCLTCSKGGCEQHNCDPNDIRFNDIESIKASAKLLG